MSRRLALIATVALAVFSVASAEWWALSLQYTIGSNCVPASFYSATAYRNNTCAPGSQLLWICGEQTISSYPSCDETQTPTVYPFNVCSAPVKRAGIITVYNCVEAASEQEALSFLAGPTDLVLQTNKFSNSSDNCDTTIQFVANPSTCYYNSPTKRSTLLSSLYIYRTCNSTHWVQRGCDDSLCSNCTEEITEAYVCTPDATNAQENGCTIIPALPAPADAPADAPVAAPMAAASPVAAPQVSNSAPTVETLAPNSATQVVLSLAVVVASVLAVLF